MSSLIGDVRYAARKLLRTPGFTLVVVLTLGLAIGATTAVFSVIDGVLLKALPFPAPERVVEVGSMSRDGKRSTMSWMDFMDYRAHARSFAAMAAYDPGTVNFTAPGSQPLRLASARVSATFFDVLRVPPLVGSAFRRGDDAQGAPYTAILAEATWRTRFGADPGIVGQVIDLNGRPTKIVGVAPAAVNWPRDIAVWLPLIPDESEADPANRGGHYLRGIARLRDGVSVEQAATELAGIAGQLEKQYPQSNTGLSATAVPLRDAVVGDVERPLYVMFGCVGFVLLIACANVANLMLVRAAGRETEMAVRRALGAGRRALLRQLLSESLLLAVVGAGVGVLLAGWSIGAIVAFAPKDLPRVHEIGIDVPVLLFTIAVTLAAGGLFGLAPAVHALRTNTGQMLRESVRGSSGRRGAQRARNALVVAEMALALVLLIGAGLLIRSFAQLTHVPLGYEPEHVITASVSLPAATYQWDAQQIGFVDHALESVRAIPGVEDAAIAFGRPLQLGGIRNTFEATGLARSTPEKRYVADVRMVTPGFFSTLRIPIVAGRAITPQDNAAGLPVVVVSQAFVKTYYPNDNPIGKRVTLGWSRQRSPDTKDTVTSGGVIVGVVADIKARDLKLAPPAIVYAPLAQFPFTELNVIARSSRPAGAVIEAVRAAVRGVDPNVPVYEAKSMAAVVSDSISQPRFFALLLSAFAAIALVIAALGIYGVISYTVSQRTRELGIRIALGATEHRVVKLVVGQGIRLTALGAAIGLVGAYELTRVIAKLLFSVGPTDPVTFAGVTVLLVAVASAASLVPAQRAARVDPALAMRAE